MTMVSPGVIRITAEPRQRPSVLLRLARSEIFAAIASPILILAAWEALVRVGLLDARFFPAPSSVVVALFDLVRSGQLFVDIGWTVLRVLVGTLLGAIPGLVFGVLLGLSPVVRAFVQPAINALYPIPKIAMFPLVMIIAPIFRVFAPLGLTNSLTGLVIIYTAYNVPFATFLMQSFFDAIPKELEEAAMIDGATRFTALRQIILPLTLPGIAATLGFVFTAAWSELLFALMLNSTTNSSTFPVGLLTFVSKFSVDFGQMMAAGVLALIPVCIFFFLIQKHLVQGLTAGAVKG